MADVTIGQLLDKKYRIVRLLGEGGMGAVYEGENVRIHHRVAIKLLHAGIADNASVVERFEREAQAAGKIGSDHIVEVYDLGELPSGSRYMVMEYLDGENLTARVTKAGRLTPQVAAPLMVQLLEGLEAAHKAGIVHRDLKPDNIFLTKDKRGEDFVKIVDFGVSKFNQLSGDSGMSMTRTGAVIGTPYYMSPEQAKGSKQSDHRSDIYSAGVVLFECITGQVPYLADTFNELMFKIVLEPPPAPESLVPGLDPNFAAIIKKGMAREPSDRFQTSTEFAEAISQWMAGTPQAFRPPMQSSPMSSPSPMASTGAGGPVMADIMQPAVGQTNPGQLPLAGTTGAGSMTSSVKDTGAKKSSAVVAIAAVAAVLLLGGIGAVVLMKGGGDKTAAGPAPTTTATTVTAPTTPAVTTPTATPTAQAAPTAQAEPAVVDAGASAVTTVAQPADTGRSGRSGSRTTRTTAPTAGEKPPTAATPAPVTTGKSTQVQGRAIEDKL